MPDPDGSDLTPQEEELDDAGISAYQQFVDAAISLAHEVAYIQAIKNNSLTDNPGNEGLKSRLSQLTPEQRDFVAEQMEGAREGGIAALLFFMHDRGYQIIAPNGVKLPRKPFGNDILFDFHTRLQGEDWIEWESMDSLE